MNMKYLGLNLRMEKLDILGGILFVGAIFTAPYILGELVLYLK